MAGYSRSKRKIPVFTDTADGAITPSIRLHRVGASKGSVDLFELHRRLEEGGSCVCFEATLPAEKKTGRLKELYPLECLDEHPTFRLTRRADNALVATQETRKAFEEEREKFVSAHQRLLEVAQEQRENEFSSFIPDFTVYYACDEKGTVLEGSTAYIWTAPEQLVVFDKYIDEVRKQPDTDPEQKLLTVLKTVETLTECVGILHKNGLLHLDIKPSNFGIPQRSGRLLTDLVTMFDVNSIDDAVGGVCSPGTPGFAAPELSSGRGCRQSDIYSIGCTLFSALVVNDRIGGIGYSTEYYMDLRALINSSALITASESNSNVFLREWLFKILQKCLRIDVKQRYQGCEELLADLRRATSYLHIDRSGSAEKRVDARLSFMYHLYKCPLFSVQRGNGKEIDVLILGFGTYGQKFLDCCLQLGQVVGSPLNVKVVSGEREGELRGEELYLSARPALTSFFCVNGTCCEEPYGAISFESRNFSDNEFENVETVRQILADGRGSRYVFVALGDDALNESIAKIVAGALRTLRRGGSPVVGYAVEGERPCSDSGGVKPIYLARDITAEPEFRALERMAFNAHLIWERGPATDLASAYRRFSEPYSYLSSFSNAVSVKYKLHSLGIPLKDFGDAASAYRRCISAEEDARGEKRRAMTAAEHRRWVCERICDGWVCNETPDACIDGRTGDARTKRHVCLVRSSPEEPLRAWSHEHWDTAGEEEIAALDPLDRASVLLHRGCKREADRIRRTHSLLDHSMLQLRRIAQRNEQTDAAFAEWYSCLALLWNGSCTPIKDYGRLKEALLRSLAVLGDSERAEAERLIGAIDGGFSVVLASMRYTSHKGFDADLTERIPFILTYRRDIHLAIPFSFGTDTEAFVSVAAATVVNPGRITYFYHFHGSDEIAEFLRAVDYVLEYMREKTLSARLCFCLTFDRICVTEREMSELCDRLLSAEERIEDVSAVGVEDARGAVSELRALAEAGTRIDGMEKNGTPLSRLFAEAGVYGVFPSYLFDSDVGRFRDAEDCDALNYVKPEAYLRVSDMLASNRSNGHLESHDAFYNDYEALWRIYRTREIAWRRLCTLLADYHAAADRVTAFPIGIASEHVTQYRFLIPSYAYDSAEKLIRAMVEAGVFGAASGVFHYTTDTCEVTVLADAALGDAIKRLFADPRILGRPDSIHFEKTAYSINVFFNSLVVERLELGSEPAGSELAELLRLLETKLSMITGYAVLEKNDGCVCFTYATPRIKALLTCPDNILEVYIYHKCLQSGFFDDVETSYKLCGAGDSPQNEVDVILTKGFCGLFVAVRAGGRVGDGDCRGLSRFSEKFGIHCAPVLIADVVGDDPCVAERLSERGRAEGVRLITDPEEIDSVDATLAALLAGDAPRS